MRSDGLRVDWVDAAKAICIVFVVMMHSTLGVEKALGGATGFMHAVTEFAKPFRMPDFFLISGLFMARVVSRDWRTFIDKRIIHFFYFYVLWLAIQYGFKGPGMVAENGVAETLRAFAVSLFLDPFGTLWFIWILPFFALAVRLSKDVPVAAVFGAAAALEMLHLQTGWVAIDEGSARFVYFFAGYAFAPAVFRFAAAVSERPLLALAGLLGWGLVNGALVHFDYAHLPLVSLLLGFAGALAIVTVAVMLMGVARLAPAVKFVGEHSLVVYLGFFLPMVITREVLIRTGLVPDIGWMSVIVTVAAVIGPFVMWKAARMVGADFLYERPAFARLDAPRRNPSAVAAE